LRWIRKFGDNIALADKNSNGSLVSVYAHVTQSQRNKLYLNEWGIGAGNTEERRSDGVVALAACSRTRTATAVSFPSMHTSHGLAATS
jgi:hypothetical protein